MIDQILKEAHWIKTQRKKKDKKWLEKVVKHETPTGQIRKVKVRSLSRKEKIKYAPPGTQLGLAEEISKNRKPVPRKKRPKREVAPKRKNDAHDLIFTKELEKSHHSDKEKKND
jgi:hypothetical protein